MGPPFLLFFYSLDWLRVTRITEFIGDRIQVNSVLVVLSFLSMVLLSSQSAASYPTYLLAAAMLATWRQWSDVFRLRMLWLILALLAYMSASSLWSEPFAWRDVASVAVRAFLIICFVVAVAECQLRGQLQRWLGRALAVSGAVAVAAALVVYMQAVPADGRLKGLGQLDNQVVAALVFGAAVVLALNVLLTERSVYWKVIAGISVTLLVVAIALSDSRNAWASGFLGISVLVLSHRINDRQKFIMTGIALLLFVAVVLTALALNPETNEAVFPRGDSYRLEIWQSILQRGMDEGLMFGAGINASDETKIDGIMFLHPHSLYLSVWYQGGLVALAGFLAMLGAVLTNLMANYGGREAKLALGMLAVALPSYLLDGHELIDKVSPTWILLWLPVGIALGYAWTQSTKPL